MPLVGHIFTSFSTYVTISCFYNSSVNTTAVCSVKLVEESASVCDEPPFPSSFFLLQGNSSYSNRVNRKIRENDCLVYTSSFIISS